MKKTSSGPSAFDRIAAEFMNDCTGEQMLADCMTFDLKAVSKVPLRYRIIALGFARGDSLEDLNRNLKASGCMPLYSRSFFEAGLIFAFLNHLSYQEWKELLADCEEVRNLPENEPHYFQDTKITFAELERYVLENSGDDRHMLETRHLTRVMEKRIAGIREGRDGFRAFLLANTDSFSTVREKTRYYFCKYLYYYLLAKIDRCETIGRERKLTDSDFAELIMFKGISSLKRQTADRRGIGAFLRNASISCGEIFDAFNYYFFEYVSLDWIDILLEYYGNPDALSREQRQKLAASLRLYDPALKKLSDDELIERKIRELENHEKELDTIYSLEGGSRGYQRNRSGENTVRKYIKGALDIDRTTLICFLLFFGSTSSLPSGFEITENRLNQILLECGFASIHPEDPFDGFVLRYLSADDPQDCLMEEVTKYALKGENFYLYHMYQSSGNYEQELLRILGM